MSSYMNGGVREVSGELVSTDRLQKGQEVTDECYEAESQEKVARLSNTVNATRNVPPAAHRGAGGTRYQVTGSAAIFTVKVLALVPWCSNGAPLKSATQAPDQGMDPNVQWRAFHIEHLRDEGDSIRG
jgi:hypothetical protein